MRLLRTFNHVARLVGIVFAGSALWVAPASADTAKDYNVFVFKNYKASNSDVQGRLAAGGDVQISNYSVGTSLPSSANKSANLVVGGKLTASNGQLAHGSAVAKSLSVSQNFGAPTGTISIAPMPVDFSAEQLRLSSLSTTLATMSQTAGVINKFQYGGFTLTTAITGLSVFNITAANANNFTLTATKPGAVVLINVAGTSASFQNMGFSFSGIDAAHVLFNFQDATTLTLGGIGFLGSILAPKADVNFNNGNMTGTMIAKSLTGNGEFHLATFQGDLLDVPKKLTQSAVPEPSSWMTMILGFGVAGFALRRSRRKPALERAVA